MEFRAVVNTGIRVGDARFRSTYSTGSRQTKRSAASPLTAPMTLGYHDAVVDSGAAPFSPNRNAKPWTTLTAARDKLLRTSKYFGREL